MGAIKDQRLGDAAFRVFCCVCGHADEAGMCRLAAATIAGEIDKARSTVTGHLNTLESLGYITKREQGQLVVVAHDLKRPATPKGGGLLGHFTARVPAWDAHIRFCRWGRDRDGSEWVRPPQYRWTTPEGEERHAPSVTFGSMCIGGAFLVKSLRVVQKLARQGLAP
jgi:DNA-binding transcriptional ArsR family regulator